MAIDVIVFDLKDDEREFFKKNDLQFFNFTFYKESLDSEFVKTIPQEIKDKARVISVFTDSIVSEDVIKEFKNLRIISTRSTDYDHINQKAACERNIAVLNVPNYGEKSVAQFTFCLIFALVRNLLPAGINHLKNEETIGRDISKMSIGIVGTGAIGGAVCKIADFFNMKTYGYDLRIKQELIDKYNIEYLPFDELLKKSDIVTVHIPYTCDNFRIFSDREFNLMKWNSYFINTSPLKLINTESLYNALKSGKLKGAAVDTINCQYKNEMCNLHKSVTELCDEEEKYLNLLKTLDNVIITPHLAYNTKEALNYILEYTINQIRENIQGGNIYGIM